MRKDTDAATGRSWFAVWVTAFGLVVVAFLAVGTSIRESAAASFATEGKNRDARGLIFTALKDQLDEETGVRGYQATHEREFLEPYESARAEMPGALTELATDLQALGLPEAAKATAAARETNQEWLTSVAEPLASGRQVDEVGLERRGKLFVDDFRIEAKVVDDALAEQYSSYYATSERQLENIGILVAIGAVLILGTGLIFARVQIRAWDRVALEREKSEEARRRAGELRSAFETERRIAERFQRALAHREFPKLPWLRFSATYSPASEQAKVGGDWYDVFALGERRALVVIGDIAGHGIEAALAMNRVRNAVLAAALVEADSAAILERVNRDVLRDESVVMATAIVGVVDAAAHAFEYATAGHPPPILLPGDGPPRLLDVGSLPLGVSDKTRYATHRVDAAPGAMIVLYTDGAVEGSRDVLEGERHLLAAVAGAYSRGEAHPASAIYRDVLGVGSVADDVAILTVGIVDGSAGRTTAERDASKPAPADRRTSNEDDGRRSGETRAASMSIDLRRAS